jgi:hypothetical protein
VEARVIAYKFLDAGAVSPFARFRWPVGDWIEADGFDPCRRGIHACRPRDLPFWLGSELWEIELRGDVLSYQRKVVASSGRLVRRLEGWSGELLAELGRSVLARTRERFGSVPVVSGYVGDIERLLATGRVPLAAFAAARAAEHAGGSAAYERERLRQAAWLAERLGLPEP